MSEEKQRRPAGRPKKYKVERVPITIHWPVDLIEYIDAHSDNRTKWLIEAAEEKRAREEAAQSSC